MNLIRLARSRMARPARVAASVLAVAAVTATSRAVEERLLRPHKASHLRNVTDVKRPRLKHGVLTIRGSEASDAIELRLQAGDPGVLEVDLGANGSADFSSARKRIASIAIDGRAGDDLVRIDESNGAFTDSIPTTIDGGAGNDTLSGGSRAEALIGGDGNDTIDGNKGNDLALLGAGDDTFVWDPGDGIHVVDAPVAVELVRYSRCDTLAARTRWQAATSLRTRRANRCRAGTGRTAASDRKPPHAGPCLSTRSARA